MTTNQNGWFILILGNTTLKKKNFETKNVFKMSKLYLKVILQQKKSEIFLMTNVAIVAALCSSTGAIGCENNLPWSDHLSIDMSFFRLITTVPWFLSSSNKAEAHQSISTDEAHGHMTSTIDCKGILNSKCSYYKNKFKLNFPDLSLPITKTSNAVIMGRKTADSIPVPLPLANRATVVLTKNHNKREDHGDSSNIYKNEKGVFYSSNFLTIKEELSSIMPISNIMVIGGAQIYHEYLNANIVDHLFLTFVSLNGENAMKGADVYFPQIPENYKLVENISAQIAKALLEWTSTSENVKRLLKNQLNSGDILETGYVKEEKGHLLQFLWFQKIS